MFQGNHEEGMNIHLLDRAKKGDQAAFNAVIQPLENKLYRIARCILSSSDDCADALQEALLKAWLSLPSLRNMERFEPWLIRIVKNECRNLYRKNRRKATHPLDEADATYEMTNDGSLRAALDLLTQQQRLLITLHHILGYTVEEIARIEHLRPGTVKSRLSRARSALSAHLEGRE